MHPSQFMQPQIVLLKQGTDTSQGKAQLKAQLISNINACQARRRWSTWCGPRWARAGWTS